MIKLHKVNQKQWNIIFSEDEEFKLKLIPSSVTNRFNIIADFIENVSKTCGEDFDKWFKTFLFEYSEDYEGRYRLLEENVNNIKTFVDEYVNRVRAILDREYSEVHGLGEKFKQHHIDRLTESLNELAEEGARGIED